MKKFSSIFSEEIREYIDLKRSMGFKLAGIEMNLGALDRFFKDAGIDEKKLSKKVVDSWCQNEATKVIEINILEFHSSGA